MNNYFRQQVFYLVEKPAFEGATTSASGAASATGATSTGAASATGASPSARRASAGLVAPGATNAWAPARRAAEVRALSCIVVRVMRFKPACEQQTTTHVKANNRHIFIRGRFFSTIE